MYGGKNLFTHVSNCLVTSKCFCVAVRSVGHTKEVMLTEVKTLADVKTALLAEVMHVQKLFDPLYAVLTKLIDLPPGRYMLQHLAKMGAFAMLYAEAPG
jgi:hypothetical protein